MKRFLIKVTGIVQGVGYRFYVQREALNRELTGWVKNKEDGSVEIEVVGSTDLLDDFLKSVKQGPRFSKVEQITVQPLPSSEPYKSFKIK